MKKEDFAICALIRIYRKKYNLSQSELAEGICVPSYVSKIENAEIEPNEQIIELLLKKFGVNFYQYGDFQIKKGN